MKKLLLLFILLVEVFNVSAQSPIDSLLKLSERANEIEKCELYFEISQKITRDTLKSNSYIRMAYNLALKNNYKPEQAKAFFYFGENAYNSFEYPSAYNWYNKALPLFLELNDSLNITDCYKSIGLCHHAMYQNEKAIAQFIEGMKYCEKDKINTAKLIFHVANTHLQMRNFKDATNNFRKALSLNTSINNYSGIAANYNGLGIMYRKINRLDSALYYYSKAHMLYRKLKRKDNMAIALSNIAGIYLSYPDGVDKSIIYYNQAWEIFKEIGWDRYEVEIRQGIGVALYKQGKYQQAIDSYLLSTKLNDKYNQGFKIPTTNYDLLSRVYEKMGDYKSALKYNKLFMQYSDSLNQKEKYEKIKNLEKKYETEKKENEIIQLKAKQELTDVQLSLNRQLKQLGFITVVLLLFLIIFVLKKYFEKLKINQLLEEKNQIIEKSEQELRLINAAKNKFFSIIAHDLKNPLHSVIGYSSLLSNDYDKFTETERRKFAKDINQSTNKIFRLLQNLLEWSRSQTGRLTFEPLEIEFKKLLGNSVEVLYSLAEQKKISINIDYNEDLKLYADPQMIETVLRNLINNAIKFTPENGGIAIEANQKDDHIEIRITDSGIGISEADLQNLFRIDSKVKRKGTNNEDGSGLGLILCKEFVEKNNGTIWAISKPGDGSSFYFTIPARKIA